MPQVREITWRTLRKNTGKKLDFEARLDGDQGAIKNERTSSILHMMMIVSNFRSRVGRIGVGEGNGFFWKNSHTRYWKIPAVSLKLASPMRGSVVREDGISVNPDVLLDKV